MQNGEFVAGGVLDDETTEELPQLDLTAHLESRLEELAAESARLALELRQTLGLLAEREQLIQQLEDALRLAGRADAVTPGVSAAAARSA